MKKLILAFSLLISGQLLFAQITYLNTDWISAGETVNRYVDTLGLLGPGSTGPNQVWDFSTAQAHRLTSSSAVNPASTPFAASFAGSNVALTSDNISYAFFSNTAVRNTSTGFAGDLLGDGNILTVPFVPDVTIYQYPVMFGNTFLDTYGLDAEADGSAFSVYRVRLKRVGLVLDTIDAWGTITTPDGSFDALRSVRTDISTDSLFIKLASFLPWQFFDAFQTTTVSYAWLAKESKLALAELTLDSLGNPNELTITSAQPTIVNPPVITGLYTDKIAPKSARLNWTPDLNAHHYRIRGRNIASPNWANILIANPTISSKDLSGLGYNTSYIWQIESFYDAAETQASGWSVEDTFTTGCLKPDTMWTGPITGQSARFNWTRVTGAAGYEIRGRLAGSGGFKTILVGGGSSTSRDVTILNPGINYEWGIKTWCDPAGLFKSSLTPYLPFTTPGSRLSDNGDFNENGARISAIYPVPTTGMIYAHLNTTEETRIELTDISGRMISSNLNTLVDGDNLVSIDISDLPNGVYQLFFHFDNEVEVKRVVLAR